MTKTAKPRKKLPFNKEQRKLWRLVKEHILEEPRRLDMNVPIFMQSKEKASRDSTLPPCGTTGCLAGIAVLIDAATNHRRLHLVKETNFYNGSVYKVIDWDVCRQRAIELLGLTENNAEKVFQVYSNYSLRPNPPCWRPDFRKRFQKAKTPKGRARVLADLIDYVLEHGVDW